MAKPDPERELERLRSVLRGKQTLPGVMLLTGASEFFRREAVDIVIASVAESAELRSIDGTDGKSDGRELDDLRGAASLFGSATWLIIRRAGPWLKTHLGSLPDVLAQRAAGCHLVVDVPKLDRRTKAAKALVAAGEAFEFRELYAEPYDRSRSPLDAELVGWVVRRARSIDLRLSPEAAFWLVTSVGHDPGELLSELRRLAPLLAVDGGGVVDPQRLRQHLQCSFESTPFEFAEAVLAQNRRRAERSLAALFARGVRGRDGGTGVDRGGVFPFVTSWLHQSLSKATEGRRLLDSGVAMRDIAKQLGVRTFVERFEAQVRGCSAAWLVRALQELHDANRRLRLDGEDPERLLARFVARTLSEKAFV